MSGSLSDAQRAALATAIEQLAWTAARESLHWQPGGQPHPEVPDADARQLWLAALTSLLAIRDSAEQLAASAALSAAQRGAEYPAIGDAAGMTRQGARRKWPGLAGLTDERQRKLAWWDRRGTQFTDAVRAVLAVADGQDLPWLANLRSWLAELETVSPKNRLDAFDTVLVDAHAVALNAPIPIEPSAALSIGLLAALTADAHAATNGHSALIDRAPMTCGITGCHSEPVVGLLRSGADHQTVPHCRRHAVEELRQPTHRIASAYQPDVALSVFTEAHEDRSELG